MRLVEKKTSPFTDSRTEFLFASQALYAVDRRVEFTPYRATFELAECRVDGKQGSRR